ncbi:MAG: hypothetical protein H6709_17540 [Kofleriaceae bacterium]|nr:hypothetical protein [Myxococcales bacterium]MCB9564462.1 hypothetical protein [Kofleriaceae bacterium]MCB9573887.1 hypothetical protein [Kofleriaceae bacterium]
MSRRVAPPRGAVALVLALGLAAVAGCGATEASPPDAGAVAPPDAADLTGFPPMVVPADNPTTAAGVALGRQLYYDPRLSHDGTRACASCHRQDRAFSNPTTPGVLAHINLAWSRNFLWNGRVSGTLEDAMTMEVEGFFATDVTRLQAPDLEVLFEDAFGSPGVTTQRAAYALAQFQRTLVSADSRFDRYARGDLDALDDAERRGMWVFYSERAECFHCHATRLFTDNEFHNIGLDAEVAGTGRGAVTGEARDDGRFKTPTLRNVERTAPYMHDDRFATLEEVVDFYSEGPVDSPTLDTLIHLGGFGLTTEERADLVAFLRALTDDAFLENPDLGPP